METRNTQPASNVANPQDAGSTNGASNGADFQSTAPSEALRNEVDNLTVQETGEPAAAVAKPADNGGIASGWIITVGIMIVVGLIVLVKLLKETVEEEKAPARRTVSTAAGISKTVKKQTAKKTAAKKKAAPNQRRKKTTSKKKR